MEEKEFFYLSLPEKAYKLRNNIAGMHTSRILGDEEEFEKMYKEAEQYARELDVYIRENIPDFYW